MQLTSGKTYTFVGTSGGYSNNMCVTAGMFTEAAITSWCIVVQLTIGGGQTYIDLTQNLQGTPYVYLLPDRIMPEDLNTQQSSYTYGDNPLQFSINNNIYPLNGINLGSDSATEEPFRLGPLGQYNSYLNGSIRTVYRTTLSYTNAVTCENISILKTSSASSFTIQASLLVYNYKDNELQTPQILWGNDKNNLGNNGGTNFIWSIHFPYFNSTAQLYSGNHNVSGNISTSETYREQKGNTLYRYVNVSVPAMYFIQS